VLYFVSSPPCFRLVSPDPLLGSPFICVKFFNVPLEVPAKFFLFVFESEDGLAEVGSLLFVGDG
jgi:hypothetical protein